MKERSICLALCILLGVGCSSMNPSDWNKRERGTAIGGASGAALGGIIGSHSGNTGTGALLGGAAGAGAGHLVGREMEKRDRRDDDDRQYRGRYNSDTRQGSERDRHRRDRRSLYESDARGRYLEREYDRRY